MFEESKSRQDLILYHQSNSEKLIEVYVCVPCLCIWLLFQCHKTLIGIKKLEALYSLYENCRILRFSKVLEIESI